MQNNSWDLPILVILVVILVLVVAFFTFYLFHHYRDRNRGIAEKLPGQGRETVEKKIQKLNAELHKLSRENDGLNRVIREYNGIQHEYDSLRHVLNKAYKVKYYPGAEIKGVLDTEEAVAGFAYQNFLKPMLAIADANKNHPARITEADRKKILDLLVSLSFLYTEYLYLRIGELSIGGNMVERISHFQQGKGVNHDLLKKLDTQNGSRALVVKLVLDKYGIDHLSYPVFDETDLNK